MAAAVHRDAWASRYTASLLAAGAGTDAADARPTPTDTATAPPPASTLGLASSVVRSRSPSPSPAPRPAAPPHAPGGHFPQLSDPATGVLSKVCGSLVAPDGERARWACAGCGDVFARDATIYPAPAPAASSPSAAGAAAQSSSATASGDGPYYCHACYVSLFSLGPCASPACGRAVLGSTKHDGAFVRVRSTGDVYHGRCFVCVHCRATHNVLLGMHRLPVCEACFDLPAPAPAPAGRAAHQHDTPDHASHARPGSGLGGSASRNTTMAASIAELSTRFGKLPPRSASSATIQRSQPLLSSSSASSASGAASQGALVRSTSHATTLSMPPPPGSPPKPRPLTAFSARSLGRSGPLPSSSSSSVVDLAAFRPSAVGSTRAAGGHLSRQDSRSRSLSPVKAVRAVPLPLPQTQSQAQAQLADANTTIGLGLSDGSAPRRASVDVPRMSSPAAGAGAGDRSACASCGLGAFAGRQAGARQSLMVRLASGEQLHAECFVCCVCAHTIDPARPFVRTDDAHDTSSPPLGQGREARYAHAGCAPVARSRAAVSVRPATLTLPGTGASTGTGSGASSRSLSPAAQEHATHQRSPRSRDVSPSRPGDRVVESYLPRPAPGSHSGSTSTSALLSPSASPALPSYSYSSPPMPAAPPKPKPAVAGHSFKSTAGAAQPTKAGLLAHAHAHASAAATGTSRNPAAGMFKSSTAPLSAGGSVANANTGSASSGTAGPRFGGMQTCPSCQRSVTPLESVPGPRGTRWHAPCLVCCAELPAATGRVSFARAGTGSGPKLCGKKLDSGAKVDVEGRVLCRDCFDRVRRR